VLLTSRLQMRSLHGWGDACVCIGCLRVPGGSGAGAPPLPPAFPRERRHRFSALWRPPCAQAGVSGDMPPVMPPAQAPPGGAEARAVRLPADKKVRSMHDHPLRSAVAVCVWLSSLSVS